MILKRIPVVFFFFAMLWVNAQQTVTLQMCYDSAVRYFPLSKQYEMLIKANELKIKNLNKNFLPTLMLNGDAHYQSDVTQVPVEQFPVPVNIPVLSKDWYKASVDISQTIYDGSSTKKMKNTEEINLKIEEKNIDIEIFKLKQSVKQIYFNIILLKEGEKVLSLVKETLTAKLKEVKSGVETGVILSSNFDILKAEIIDINQKIAENGININTQIESLNELTGLSLNRDVVFEIPEPEIDTYKFENNRPEYSLLTLQQVKLQSLKTSIASRRLPRLSLYGQLGYGRPAYDMLKNEFDDFYMAGLRLNWNIFDWNLTKNEKQIFDIQSDILNTKKETFDVNLKVELKNKLGEVKKYEDMIEKDKEIILLREKIAKTASSQLNNGVITSTEYLKQVNEAAKAKLNLNTHKIMLVKAKLDYLASLGNL